MFRRPCADRQCGLQVLDRENDFRQSGERFVTFVRVDPPVLQSFCEKVNNILDRSRALGIISHKTEQQLKLGSSFKLQGYVGLAVPTLN
jgi:hypothetical protein